MNEFTITTPIDSFANPETGSQIELVSLIHIGTPEYYRRIGNFIMGKQGEGYLVQYEGIVEEKPDETSTWLERMKYKIQDARVGFIYSAYSKIDLGSSYTIQNEDSLFMSQGSERKDVTGLDIVKNSGVFSLLSNLISSIYFASIVGKAYQKGTDELDSRLFKRTKKITTKLGEDSKSRLLKRPDLKVLLDYRNQVALEGVDQAIDEDEVSKLVLVWGMSHLAGLKAGLIERGYEHANSQDIMYAFDESIYKKTMQKRQVKLDRMQAKIDRLERKLARRPKEQQFPR